MKNVLTLALHFDEHEADLDLITEVLSFQLGDNQYKLRETGENSLCIDITTPRINKTKRGKKRGVGLIDSEGRPVTLPSTALKENISGSQEREQGLKEEQEDEMLVFFTRLYEVLYELDKYYPRVVGND